MSTEEHGQVFRDGKFDGVFGMGKKQLASILKKEGDDEHRADPFYINAIHQHLLQKPEFSFYVSAKEGNPGAVVLGGTNRKLYKGEISWHKVHSPAYWMMDIHSIRVGENGKTPEEAFMVIDTSDDELHMNNLRGIADSGTSLLVGPPKVVKPILKHVNVADDCSNMDDLKTLYLSMKDTRGKLVHYKLTPEQYVLKRDEFGTKRCKTGIGVMNLQLPGTHPIMILGDTFLRAHYSVYNHERDEVGFAPANHADEEGDDPHLPKLDQIS